MIGPSKKYQLRDGRAWRFLSLDGPKARPLVGVVTNFDSTQWVGSETFTEWGFELQGAAHKLYLEDVTVITRDPSNDDPRLGRLSDGSHVYGTRVSLINTVTGGGGDFALWIEDASAAYFVDSSLGNCGIQINHASAICKMVNCEFDRSQVAGSNPENLEDVITPLRPSVWGRTLGVESDGDLTKVNLLDGNTPQTQDHTNAVNATNTNVNELATDLADGGRLDLLIDGILEDTDVLQLDWANGGRLDLILDARASQSSVDAVNMAMETTIPGILGTPVDTIAEDIANVEGGGGGTSQPRVNKPAGEAFQVELSRRADGTIQATKRIRIGVNDDNIAVQLITAPVFGDIGVKDVGEPSTTGTITTAYESPDGGPRDNSAMFKVTGGQQLGVSERIDVPITMETGETITGSVFVDVVSVPDP